MSKRRKRQQEQLQKLPVPQQTSGQSLGVDVEFLQERLAELELALEDQGWQRLLGDTDREFSREALREICRLARLFYLKNPLVRRSVDVQAEYVFAQGMTVRAADPLVNDVIQAFLDDAQNKAELTSHQARMLKEVELQIEGNLFFVLFINRATGRVQVRTIPFAEIDEVLCNPEDAKDPWYYRRSWQEQALDGTVVVRTAYYPDWRYRPKSKQATLNGHPVLWDMPVYHVKVGGLSDMRFGVPEVYPALDWAKAYKAFLEDWATLTRAYSRFAHKLTVPGGKAGVVAAKTRLATTYGVAAGETNPAPLTGSTFIAAPGVDLQPVRIGGANVSAEDGRRLLLMVAAAAGLPESFFGDVSVGTLATAKSLDRPTELKMRSRQTLWADVHYDLLGYVIEQSVRAPGGTLKGQIIDDDDGTPVVVLEPDPQTGQPRDASLTVTFPPILEHDVAQTVAAIVDAATLKGQPSAGTMAPETLSRLLLTALGVEDVDAELEAMMLDDEWDEKPEESTPTAEAAQFLEAARELREAVQVVVEQNARAA